MSQGPTPVPGRRVMPRPPRINIKNLHNNNGSMMGSYPPTAQIPFTAQSINTMGPGGMSAGPGEQPYWPAYANPFAAGNFMAKGFEGFVDFTKSGMSSGEKFTYKLYSKISKWSKKWFTHFFLLFIMILYSVGGAVIFTTVEGGHARQILREDIAKQKVFFKNLVDVARDIQTETFNRSLFEGNIRETLREHYDEIQIILKNNDNKSLEEKEKLADPWTFWNAMFYCGTIFTTIGYGHITPKTTLGQSLTIVYAIIGIPMFLILLADFGKLFTRMMKFMWAYVRRLYYTGRCRRIRKQQQFQDAIGGFNAMYDMAVRRPSAFFGINNEPDVESQLSEAAKSGPHSYLETPTTPYPETFEIDDEFNLPVSLASVLLISYIVVGATVYNMWEDWTYFQSFYFVFISMSTIGFGDLVPNHPIFMMCSIIYLIFGLALTSMFINVVQIKLSDTFKQASSKLGATIGFDLPSELGDETGSQAKTPTELPQIHNSRLDKISEDDQESIPPPVNRSEKPRFGDGDGLSSPELLPKRQTSVEEKPETVVEKNDKKKRRRFFK